MNADRRKKIRRLIDRVESLEEAIQEVMNEEQNSFDSLPESLQYSSKGEKMTITINKLDNSLVNLDDVMEWLLEIKED